MVKHPISSSLCLSQRSIPQNVNLIRQCFHGDKIEEWIPVTSTGMTKEEGFFNMQFACLPGEEALTGQRGAAAKMTNWRDMKTLNCGKIIGENKRFTFKWKPLAETNRLSIWPAAEFPGRCHWHKTRNLQRKSCRCFFRQ